MHICYFLSRSRRDHLVCYFISCTLSGNSDMYGFYGSSNFKTKATYLLTRTFYTTVPLRAGSNYVKLFAKPIKRETSRNLRCSL